MLMQQKCFPCLFRQALDAAELLTTDVKKREMLIRGAGRIMAETNFCRTPPEIGQELHAMIREVLENDDPYREIKAEINSITKEIRPTLREKIEKSENPLETALRFAIAGNVIDFATFKTVSADKIIKTVEEAANKPIMGVDISALEAELQKTQTRTLLYVCDNCGEIVWDALLIEQLQRYVSVTVAVRGSAVVNDAILADAELAGITEMCPVITTGSDIPGTVVALSSEIFQQHFREADVVLAKGQGNLETLQPSVRPVLHLFMVKCPVVEQWMKLPRGALALQWIQDADYIPVLERRFLGW
ncbi:MAG: ARMT1-like domain-containing protein [Planctomycetia bacterium]|nr:ARMT1-like domain-containing protein [Planctomycetia bacterium]